MVDYTSIVADTKRRHDVRVRRWRRSMTGCAWRVYYHDGKVINWIEAPAPKSPISLAIFLHEVGHHVIGFERYRKRCEEEYHVWQWALAEMRRVGVEPDARVARRRSGDRSRSPAGVASRSREKSRTATGAPVGGATTRSTACPSSCAGRETALSIASLRDGSSACCAARSVSRASP